MRSFTISAISIPIGFLFLVSGVDRIISAPSTAASTCTVVRGSVYDGDTLRVNCQGREIKIRSACIDAPERQQHLGIASRNHLRSLLNRANNQVSIKPIDTDRYRRTIAEIFTNGQLVQLQQVKNGMAWANSKYKNDCPHWSDIEKAERQARSRRVGIWATANPTPPWIWRQQNK